MTGERMTSKEFHQRVKALGVKSRAILAAHNVIVAGAGIREQARECGVTPMVLLRLVQRIRRTELCQHCGQPLKDRK